MDTNHSQSQHINQMHSLLSRVNRVLMRTENSDELYQKLCQMAIDSSLFAVAWVGLWTPNGQLQVMACCGDTVHLVNHTYSPEPNATAPDGLAAVLHSGQVFVCNHLPEMPDWLAGVVTVQGLKAMVRLPLRDDNQVIGILELYTTYAELLDTHIVGLAEDLVDDVSFALENLRREQQRLATDSKIHYLAYYDPQTGLPSRVLLEQHLNQLTAGTTLAFLDIQLRRLEPILRTLGHTIVDEIVRTLAHRLEGCRSGSELVAQLGQAEFVMLIPHLIDHDAVEAFARQLLSQLSSALTIGNREIFLSAGIGIVLYPQQEPQLQHLLRRARVAAENATDGEVCFYHPQQDHDAELRLTLESELHWALARNEFEVYYQPQLNLNTGMMIGVEALLRWRHPVRGLLSPGLFIPILEESGQIVAVGEWVLRTACLQNKAWQDAGLRPIRVAVNLSSQQFRLSPLVETVRHALHDSGLAAQWLELELTESLILENAESTIATMHALKQLGISLSLDDFGTGYSSLSYLLRFPIDRLKIDQSFVHEIITDANSAVLARTILAMAHNLGMTTIAEGVEESGQLEYLRKYACEEMQGFLFSKALPAEELTQLLHEGRRLILP